jgi:hypothetical protein
MNLDVVVVDLKKLCAELCDRRQLLGRNGSAQHLKVGDLSTKLCRAVQQHVPARGGDVCVCVCVCVCVRVCVRARVVVVVVGVPQGGVCVWGGGGAQWCVLDVGVAPDDRLDPILNKLLAEGSHAIRHGLIPSELDVKVVQVLVKTWVVVVTLTVRKVPANDGCACGEISGREVQCLKSPTHTTLWQLVVGLSLFAGYVPRVSAGCGCHESQSAAQAKGHCSGRKVKKSACMR